MPEPAFTYGLLDKKLRDRGFVPHTQKGKTRIYRHEQAGASVILPDAPFKDQVLPHHLVVVRRVLHEHDLGDLEKGQPAAIPDQGKRSGKTAAHTSLKR